MGIENSILKKKYKNGVIKFPKPKIKKKSSAPLENKQVSNILDNYNDNKNILDTKPQSKTTSKNLTSPKTVEDKPIKSECNGGDSLKNFKSLSVQNLVKLEKRSFEEVSPGSLETNCCSNKSNKNKEDIKEILRNEVYNDIKGFEEEEDEDNYEDEENEGDEKEDDGDDEENKKKELMVTNNMKTVFIDSKMVTKEDSSYTVNDENNISNPTIVTPLNTSSTTETTPAPIENVSVISSMTTYDYELNFYRNGNDIRQSYLAKLLSTKVWTPNMKPKQHNSIVIFDWDDTLLPTTFLTPGGIFNENISIPQNESEKLKKLEQAVLKLLTEAVEKGSVYIITNAGDGWVEYSSKRFYPSIVPILAKIKIISARGEYEKIFPGNSRQWKIEAFLNLQKSLNIKLVTNIICIGDSLFEIEAGRILASKFTEAFIKTIKFREAPKLDELLKQLNLVCSQFGSIYSSVKNLTIRIERKKKD